MDEPDPEVRNLQCFGQGGLCGPEALAMSGQVVLPPGAEAWAEADFLIWVAETSTYHRNCDGAVVLRPGPPPGGSVARDRRGSRLIFH